MTGGRILVTGADGFIGSHLVEELVRRQRSVRALVMYNSLGSRGWLDGIPPAVTRQIEFVTGDISDENFVRTAVKGCEKVLHLAALIAIPYSYHAPASYVRTNVNGTLNVLQAGSDFGVKRIVHTSTSEVYGTAQFVPITEEHPLQGQSPYAATKIGADQLALSFYRSFATPVTVIRPFNTYGPRQSARAVIPTIITQLLAGTSSIRLGSRHPTRDFNYVDDIVQAFIKLADSDDGLGEVINVGSGFEISIGEVAEIIAAALGRQITIETDDQRVRPEKSEVERLWADNSKAHRLFGWQPEYGSADGFRRGIAKTISWFQKPENMARYKPDQYTL